MLDRRKENFDFDVRESGDTSGDTRNAPTSLHRRAEDDSMSLYGDVCHALKEYFLNSGSTWLSDQLAVLGNVAESILSATPGTVTAVPLVPGGGKSTLIRALLCVFSLLFTIMDNPLAQKLGGVIVVVEKSAEAHELEELCNSTAGQRAAAVIEAPNNYNLRNGCPNGTATRFEECARRQCPDYAGCSLAQAASRTEETPILILLHARYQRYMEDMTSFLMWYAGNRAFRRALLLVDELPAMFGDDRLCLPALNEAEIEIDQLRASYRPEQRLLKQDILFLWNKAVRTPFFKLSRLPQCQHSRCGLVTEEMFASAGFHKDDLSILLDKLLAYVEHTKAMDFVNALLSGNRTYHSMDQTFTLFVPRLKQLNETSRLATFIFSGTATLSPELTNNPDVVMADTVFEESYARLKIIAQQGEGFSASKTGLSNIRNRDSILKWLRAILSSLAERHQKLLVVTYQSLAEWLWQQLPEYQDHLIPYIDSEGQPTAKLPYFGGINGSNLYLEATCVICVGLNRFEPGEYLNRALAFDSNGEIAQAMCTAAEDGQRVQWDQLPSVRAMEHITLARDLVQLVFRSALRKHGEQEPIEFWLLQPPDAVLEHLRQYFGDCQIEVIPELPESCRRLTATTRRYNSEGTHAAKLLRWLENSQEQEFTPEEIRKQTGLTLNQFKEARRHPEIRKYFAEHIETRGSGRNTSYRRKQNRSPPAVA